MVQVRHAVELDGAGDFEVGANGRAEEMFSRAAEKVGAKIRDVLWLAGEFDGMCVVEAPDDATAIAAVAQGDQGWNIRTRTYRAFDAAGYEAGCREAGEMIVPSHVIARRSSDRRRLANRLEKVAKGQRARRRLFREPLEFPRFDRLASAR